jgi:hypothetical protein
VEVAAAAAEGKLQVIMHTKKARHRKIFVNCVVLSGSLHGRKWAAGGGVVTKATVRGKPLTPIARDLFFQRGGRVGYPIGVFAQSCLKA